MVKSSATPEEDETVPPAEAGPGLEEERRKSEEYLNRLKYLQADFDNYRKRTARELGEARDAALREVAEKLLSVVDELEMASAHSGGGDSDGVGEGVSMVYGKLWGVLKSIGLERIACVGAPFNPLFHEAVEKAGEVGGVETVKEEVRSGYTFRGVVLRPAMVKVELGKAEGLTVREQDE